MEASQEEVIKKEKKKKEKTYIAPDWVKVDKVEYSLGESAKAGQFVRVVYHCGLTTFQESVCLEARGYAKHQANNWVKFRTKSGDTVPLVSSDVIRFSDKLRIPTRILVDTNGRYVSIKNTEFKD